MSHELIVKTNEVLSVLYAELPETAYEVSSANLDELYLRVEEKFAAIDEGFFEAARAELEDAFMELDLSEHYRELNAFFEPRGCVLLQSASDWLSDYFEWYFREQVARVEPNYDPLRHLSYLHQHAGLTDLDKGAAPSEKAARSMERCRSVLSERIRRWVTPGLGETDTAATEDQLEYLWQHDAWCSVIEALLPIYDQDALLRWESWAKDIGHESLQAWLQSYFDSEVVFWRGVARTLSNAE